MAVSPVDLHRMISLVSPGLIRGIKPFNPYPPPPQLQSDGEMIARLLRTLSQRCVEGFVGDDLLAAVCVPYPLRHLPLAVTDCPAALPHAALGTDVSVDAKPGSLSELKVAASCSLICPSRLTACLRNG